MASATPSNPDHLLIPIAAQAAYAQTRVANLPPSSKVNAGRSNS